MVTLLLPLNRYKVKYEISSGRPYSKIEQLVLRAFQEENAKTIEDLQKIFCLPKRLIVEILVTLAQASWIAISNDKEGSFVLTTQGKAALNSSDDKLPPRTLIGYQEAFIIMERFTGNLISPNEIIYQNKKELEEVWPKACKLPVQVDNNDIGIDTIKKFLPKKSGERIRFIANPVLISQDSYWLNVDADIEDKRVIGLPDFWQWNLKECLLEKAKNFADKYPEKAAPLAPQSPEYKKRSSEHVPEKYSTVIKSNDLLLTHKAHVEQLQKALESAKTNLVVTSAFLKSDCLTSLENLLLQALSRGVNVDLLWGYSSENQSDKIIIKGLQEIQKKAKKEQGGNFSFNQERTNSHAKLLIYDTDEGYQAYVGSYNWLSLPVNVQPLVDELGSNVTVGLRHSGLVADLCLSIASFWNTNQNLLSSDVPSRWQRIAAKLEDEFEKDNKSISNKTGSSSCKVRILHTHEHEGIMLQLIGKARKRCLIVSHQIDPSKQMAEFRLIDPLRKRLDEVEQNLVDTFVLYGDEKRLGDTEASFKQKLEKINGRLLYKQGLHAKLMVVDTVAIISSYNFLSADPRNKAKGYREIGVFIEDESGEIPDKLWEIFSDSVQDNKV